MSVRSTIQGFYGGDAPMSLSHLLDRYRDEVREGALREAAERIRGAHPMLLVRHPESPNAVALAMQSAMADLIDPDKENSADGTL